MNATQRDDADLVFAAILRPVHRLVGDAQQLRTAQNAGGSSRMHGHADTGGDDALPAVVVERLLDRDADALGDRGRALVVGVLADDDELVAAVPAHEVVAADRRDEAGGDQLEHGVAGGVVEFVVDGLEVVQVHEDQGERLLPFNRRGDTRRDVAAEQNPVGEPAHRVVQGVKVRGDLQPVRRQRGAGVACAGRCS